MTRSLIVGVDEARLPGRQRPPYPHPAAPDTQAQRSPASKRKVEVGTAAECEGESLFRRAVPGEAGGIVAGNSDPDPVAGRDDGGDGQQLHGQAHGVPGNHAKGV